MTKKNRFKSESDQPSFVQFTLRILPKIVLLLIRAIIAIPVWPVYWIGCLVWYRPPNVPYFSQVRRYLRLTWTVTPSNPGLPVFGRIWMSLTILQFYLNSPIQGLAWLLDELLYSKSLDEISVTRPFFVISAGRSGSTQITRYIEEDPDLAAPNILQCMFPYLWLWKLAPKTIGRLIKPDKVRELIHTTMPAELIERHETDPFKADTFDGAFLSFHLNRFSLNLGPQVGKDDFNMAYIAPHDRQIKEKDFVRLVDRLARKTLYYSGKLPSGQFPRFFLKGHFLFAAQALSDHYSDANFLTVIREPLSRLQSGINYMRVNPPDPVMGPVPWHWLTETLSYTEVFYSQVEMEWFTRESNTRRTVIKFTDFVNDIKGSLKTVYQDCFNTDQLPAHIPKSHPPRERKNYSINRTLPELGVDEARIQNDLREYIKWCQPANKKNG